MSTSSSSEFPFEALYEQIAKGLLAIQLGDDMFPPMMASAWSEGGELTRVEIMSPEIPNEFFRNAKARATLGQFLRELLNRSPRDRFAVVVVCEASMKVVSGKLGFEDKTEESAKIAATQRGKSLEGGPQAAEMLMIQMHTADDVQVGALPILPGRVLEYAPFRKGASKSGRFSKHPAKEDLPPNMKVH